MNAISVPSSRPLDGRKADAIARVASATRAWDSQPMLVGAFARDIWFWHLHGVETERATEDIDISISLPDWGSFDELTGLLRETGFVQLVPNHPEKFVHPGTGQKIDVLPFGSISEDGRFVVWPTDRSRWGILGFEEGYRTAPLLTVMPDNAVRIALLPALIILKLVAFYERLEDRRRKDGADIGFTLAHYLETGNMSRLKAGDDSDIMDQVRGDVQLAGAVLLGRDTGRLALPATFSHLTEKLDQELASSSSCPLAQEVQRKVTRGNFVRARALLRGMLDGIKATGKP